MTGQDLLDRLLQLKHQEGVDLRALEVVTSYTEYDPSIPYDRGAPRKSYPDFVRVDATELVL